MERLEFNNIEHIVDCCFDCLEKMDTDYPSITIYGKYEVIRDILQELVISGAKLECIELEDYDINDYDKEFVLWLKINEPDDEITVSVEKVYFDNSLHGEGRYYVSGGDISFVHEDCNSKLLKYIESDCIYEFSVGEDERINIDCCHCDDEDCPNKCLKDSDSTEKYIHYSKDDNGDMHGFTASKSDGNYYVGYSFYSTDKLDQKDIHELLKEAGF